MSRTVSIRPFKAFKTCIHLCQRVNHTRFPTRFRGPNFQFFGGRWIWTEEGASTGGCPETRASSLCRSHPKDNKNFQRGRLLGGLWKRNLEGAAAVRVQARPPLAACRGAKGAGPDLEAASIRQALANVDARTPGLNVRPRPIAA